MHCDHQLRKQGDIVSIPFGTGSGRWIVVWCARCGAYRSGPEAGEVSKIWHEPRSAIALRLLLRAFDDGQAQAEAHGLPRAPTAIEDVLAAARLIVQGGE
jgi:hypothetical protein